jgi:hypothetical protein
MVKVGSGRIVNFEIVQEANASRGGHYKANGNGMEVEGVR